MTLYEFNRLELNERMEAVNQYGTFLVNYITKDIHINCYAIDEFFVEVVYGAENNTITEVRSFKYGLELDKYSVHIKVPFKRP
ncbi:hypothetical protein [Mariniflexile sp.]|uniref:hypothetical protein n=1 Tax=Mariniflexile sp. TaxID=1979402 RepID=UPI003561CCC2